MSEISSKNHIESHYPESRSAQSLDLVVKLKNGRQPVANRHMIRWWYPRVCIAGHQVLQFRDIQGQIEHDCAALEQILRKKMSVEFVHSVDPTGNIAVYHLCQRS